VVDDACDSSLGGLLDDVRAFIQTQPATTLIGVAYMNNNTVSIAQDLTNDHDKAYKALRIPLGNPGTHGSPYLSLMDLVKRWPEHGGRKEVLVISDGIDRFRRQRSRMEAMSPSADADSASNAAQRAGVLVHSIYALGAGHLGRNTWVLNGGQNGLARIADETGGESFFLGYQNPPSFKPYLDQLQVMLTNQYWLAFEVKRGKKAGLQAVKTDTEVSGAEIVSANSVFVPGIQ